VSCPRVLHFSNPDVFYNGVPTGVLNQRDNAQTGDLTAAIVANFRAGGSSVANNPPVFADDPIIKPGATQGLSYAGTLAGDASDPDADPLTFAKVGGPAWLSVAAGGGLSGTPGAGNVGQNSFIVSASDGHGGTVSATLQFNVAASMGAPTNLTAAAGSRRIDLTWSDNSSGETGFIIYRSGNGVSFSKIATVGAGVTSFSNTGLRTGRTYYYRVRAYAGKTSTAYSNTASATAK
jgi:hypothetical protein